MEAVEQKRKDDLLKMFPMGYTLFTVTERNQVVPNGSPMDQILQVDWNSAHTLSISESSVTLKLPNMTFTPPGNGRANYSGSRVTMTRNIGAPMFGLSRIGNYGVVCKYLEEAGGSPVMALGIIDASKDPIRKPTTQP
jgi:hypothetical protein